MKHYLDKEVKSRKGFSWKDGVETSLCGERNDGTERSIYAGEKGVITELVSLRRNEHTNVVVGLRSRNMSYSLGGMEEHLGTECRKEMTLEKGK